MTPLLPLVLIGIIPPTQPPGNGFELVASVSAHPIIFSVLETPRDSCVLPFDGVIALSNHTWKGAATNVTTTPINCTGANLAVVVVADFGMDATAGTMSSSPSNTWSHLSNEVPGGFTNGAIWYSKNLSISGTMTFTYAGANPAIFVTCWSGADTSAPLDQQSTGGNTSGGPTQPGSITPGVNNELVVTGVSTDEAGVTFSINGCYSGNITDSSPLVGGVNQGGALAYCIQTTATATNPTWTTTGASNNVAAMIASFKASSGVAFTANQSVIVVGP